MTAGIAGARGHRWIALLAVALATLVAAAIPVRAADDNMTGYRLGYSIENLTDPRLGQLLNDALAVLAVDPPVPVGRFFRLQHRPIDVSPSMISIEILDRDSVAEALRRLEALREPLPGEPGRFRYDIGVQDVPTPEGTAVVTINYAPGAYAARDIEYRQAIPAIIARRAADFGVDLTLRWSGFFSITLREDSGALSALTDMRARTGSRLSRVLPLDPDIIGDTGRVTFHLAETTTLSCPSGQPDCPAVATDGWTNIPDAFLPGIYHRIRLASAALDGILAGVGLADGTDGRQLLRIDLTPDGTVALATLTAGQSGMVLAVVIDGAVLATVSIVAPLSGELVLSLPVTAEQGRRLAAILRSGPFPADIFLGDTAWIVADPDDPPGLGRLDRNGGVWIRLRTDGGSVAALRAGLQELGFEVRIHARADAAGQLFVALSRPDDGWPQGYFPNTGLRLPNDILAAIPPGFGTPSDPRATGPLLVVDPVAGVFVPAAAMPDP